ncbi:sensor histidine kinase [Robertmurraya korlensis]|uniref:sensor histidine kinase n=1 Tax=Robertmurraya korlensis TaxID=519977 RepID=UPI0008253FE4|nr:sensor histidine kinase [Robertmurraya korlensis]
MTFNKWMILLVSIFLTCILAGCTNKVPEAEGGTINLGEYSFTDGDTIKLNGEWEFYWGQLLSDIKSEQKTGYIHVPSFWGNQSVGKNELSGKGHATYRLKVVLNEDQRGRTMGLYLPFGIESAYRLYVNGELLASAGKVGISREVMEGKYEPKVVLFQVKRVNEITIQVSNYVQTTGGLWDSISMGSGEDLIQYWNNRLAKELFVAGSIVIIGLYHLGLFVIRRKDKSPLYFGAFCLLIGLRSLFLGEVYINEVIPNLPFELYKKLEYIGQYMGPAMFLLYVQCLFPSDINKTMVKIGVTFYILMSGFVMLTPAVVFTHVLKLSHIMLLILAPYVVFVFIKAAIKKREGALFSCMMFLVLALTVVNDVLHYNQVISTFDMAKFGLFSFIFAQAFLLSIKFSKAFRSVEELSLKQAKWSTELEKTVQERTLNLQVTLEDLQLTQKQLVESEKMAALGALVAGVAHEINTPVGVSVTANSFLQQKTKEMLNVLEENKLKKSDLTGYLSAANESTQIISNNLKRASELVKGFKQVAVDQTSEVKREFGVKGYLEEIIFSLGPSMKSSHVDVKLEVSEDILITSYPGVFSQIFTNLIINSLTHAFNKDKGTILIKVTKTSQLILEYRDNGKGMLPEVKKKIFDPFFTTNRANGGTGLGMHIVYNLVTQTLGGTITCESMHNEGTTFMINLPLGEKELDTRP